MEKDAYYFPHFCNARHDRKILRLRRELGVEGYGIFFMLLEVLREQIDFCYPMKDLDLLADQFNTSESKIRVVICNYQLFQLDENEQFFSPKLLIYLQPYFSMKEQRKLAGIKSGQARRLIAETPREELSELPQVYIIKCFNETEEFIKIGSTVGSISRRFSGHLPYSYEVIKQVFTSNYIKLEENIHNQCTGFKYNPAIKFSGNAECYCTEAASEIIKIVDELDFSHEHRSNTVQTKLNENEQSKEKKSKEKENKEDILGSYSSNTDLIKVIKDFKDMRTKAKKPMTDRALQLILKGLDKLTTDDETKIKILEQSIVNSWLSVYPLKQGGENKSDGYNAKPFKF